jgi:hypothetical protein
MPLGCTMATPEQIVQRQLDAFNVRDLDGFFSLFAEDVVIYDLLDGQTILRGLELFRRRYEEIFEARPHIRAELVGRLAIGSIVIDRERLSDGDAGPPEDALAIYQVDGDVVTRMWFIQPEHRRAWDAGRQWMQ